MSGGRGVAVKSTVAGAPAAIRGGSASSSPRSGPSPSSDGCQRADSGTDRSRPAVSVAVSAVRASRPARGGHIGCGRSRWNWVRVSGPAGPPATAARSITRVCGRPSWGSSPNVSGYGVPWASSTVAVTSAAVASAPRRDPVSVSRVVFAGMRTPAAAPFGVSPDSAVRTGTSARSGRISRVPAVPSVSSASTVACRPPDSDTVVREAGEAERTPGTAA